MSFSVKNITGLSSLDEEIEKEETKIEVAVSFSLGSMIPDMKDALERHVQTDVYDQYDPSVYERRSENRALGTPLIDMEVNVSASAAKNTLSFEYLPTGEHVVKKWATANGDALIGRIEKGNPPYDFFDPGPRPFWTNFCNEMILGGGLFSSFTSAMGQAGYQVIPDGGGVEPDGNDGAY